MAGWKHKNVKLNESSMNESEILVIFKYVILNRARRRCDKDPSADSRLSHHVDAFVLVLEIMKRLLYILYTESVCTRYNNLARNK